MARMRNVVRLAVSPRRYTLQRQGSDENIIPGISSCYCDIAE